MVEISGANGLFAINSVKHPIPFKLDYRKVSPKKKSEGANYLIQLESDGSGQFEAEGKGKGLSIGMTIYVSLKGSKTLTMPLTVGEIRYLIEPSDQWIATLIGDPFDNISIYTWMVRCNDCQTEIPLEFVCQEYDDQAQRIVHAESRLKALNWQVDGAKHRCSDCVTCIDKKGE